MMVDEVGELVRRLAAGEVRALARAISFVEDGGEGAGEVLRACKEIGRRGRRIGITGAPGVGKSTLVDAIVRFLREAGERVGVVAVDPSSPVTGGALLGDRVRMRGFAGDDGVYVRSMASRAAMGGVAWATADVCAVVEAAGFGTVIVETVGVGQDEVEVCRIVDCTVLVLMPGMGDEVQSLKAGVMEVADVFVVNKSDAAGADVVVAGIEGMQGLVARTGGWVAPVVRTVALTGDGVGELMGVVERSLARCGGGGGE